MAEVRERDTPKVNAIAAMIAASVRSVSQRVSEYVAARLSSSTPSVITFIANAQLPPNGGSVRTVPAAP